MTTKLRTRIKQMTFQKNRKRTIEIQNDEETKYYEEMYNKRTMELLGIKDENIYRSTRGSL